MSVTFAPPAPTGTGPSSKRLLDGVRALVVEDHEDSREVIRQILEHSGASVEEAPDAGRALECLAAGTFDVIVSDIGMQEMDGLELIAAIRTHSVQAVAQVPAVALSAHTRDVDRGAALSAGFHAHVSKPADPEALVQVVVSVLRRA